MSALATYGAGPDPASVRSRIHLTDRARGSGPRIGRDPPSDRRAVRWAPYARGVAEQKTKPTGASVRAFLDGIDDDVRRRDAKAMVQLLREVTGLKPKLWGPSIIGFGSVDYTYESGHSGTTAIIGFAPRKANTVVYLLDGFDGRDDLLGRLGPHKLGKGCLYLTRLDRVDLDVLRTLLTESFAHVVATSGDRVTLA